MIEALLGFAPPSLEIFYFFWSQQIFHFGRGGIRTHGNSRHIGFQDQHHRQLGHPSICQEPESNW